MCMWFNLLLTSVEGGFQRLKTRFVAMSRQEEVADLRKGLVDAFVQLVEFMIVEQ